MPRVIININYTRDWEESKHPRDPDGKFGSGGGGSASVKEFPSASEVESYQKQIEASLPNAEESESGYSKREALAHMAAVVKSDKGTKLSQRRDVRHTYVEQNGKLAAAGSIKLDRSIGVARIEHVGSIEKGAGSLVMNRIIKEAQNWGAKQIELETTVPKYYTAYGFVPMAEEDGVVTMRKKLK
jgi:hypothetical protein